MQRQKARTHDATLPATSRTTWKLHRVSTLEIVARNVAYNCCRIRIGIYFCNIARNCFTVCPSSATLRATSWRKSCAQCCIVCPRLHFFLQISKLFTKHSPNEILTLNFEKKTVYFNYNSYACLFKLQFLRLTTKFLVVFRLTVSPIEAPFFRQQV